MQDVVVGTAGHIDHGKSSLVLALTGTDPDRLKEEKARGITVDLGFAHLEHEGVNYGFVDVPGHERFVRNMLAGASGFDVVLLVVAADESVMPQTREHIEICRLLGVRSAVVALTRIDLVEDPEFIEIAALEVRELLQGSAMAKAPVVPVSSKTGAGLDELLRALASAASATTRDASGPFRLPVDRAFTMRGFGSVVTGTLVSGSVAAGSEVEVLPEGERARVRGLQVHGNPVESAHAGQRAALNLAGGGRLRADRGSVVAMPGALGATRMLDARLEVLGWASGPVQDEDRVHLHVGTAASLARVRLLGGVGALAPGDSGLVQMRLETPLTAVRGDRFIIRRYSPVITIGGGTIVHAFPPKRSPRSPRALERVAALDRVTDVEAANAFIEEAGVRGLGAAVLHRRLGIGAREVDRVVRELAGTGEIEALGESASGGDGRIFLSAGSVRSLEERMLARLSAWEAENRLRLGMPLEQLREQTGVPVAVADGALLRLREAGAVELTRHTVGTAGRRVALSKGEQRALDGLAGLIEDGGFTPPTAREAAAALQVAPALVDALRRLLLGGGRVVAVSPDLYFDGARIAELREAVADRAAVNPEIDVAWFKERFGLSRKHAIPLLEWLDRERVTVRVGNLRRIRTRSAPRF
ncbi:MAG: selenocysteine-specific translation elongation factor [Acidobacteria bacterium]|nr:selenocysteine-specific translation elongation factor [Acidobacteriota bacterium]